MKRQNGFTLIEMLVSLIITMSALAVIVEVQTQSENVRRTSQGNQSAQYSGLMAIQTLDMATKKAGFGFNVPNFAGTTINYYNPTASALKTETWAPILITQSGVNSTVRLMWSDNNISLLPIKPLTTKTAGLNSIQLNNIYGVNSKDILMYVESGKAATIHQISAIDTPTQTVQHATTGTAPYNYDMSSVYPSSGYTVNSKIFNLGTWPRLEFSVVSNQLWLKQKNATGETNSLLAENVLGLRAQYGIDDGGSSGTADDGYPDTWTINYPSNQQGWARVVAVKYAVLTRNANTSKDNVTATFPKWSGGVFDVSSNTNWRNVRYRVYEAIIPLKNNVWTTPDV